MKIPAAFKYLFFLLILFSAGAIVRAQTCVPVSTAAGSLDSCFGVGGKVTTKISAGEDVARSVVTQADGKIIVAGFTDWNGSPDFAVVRYNADGSLDTSFDGDGKVTTDFNGQNDFGMSVKLQTDGKIVVAGVSANYFAVARYNSDGSPDNSFDNDGKILTSIGALTTDFFTSMEIQRDGKIVVSGGGDYFGYLSSRLNVVRYNADGSLDDSFDGDGRVILSEVNYGGGVAIQNDGKILITGRANERLIVARLNTNGSFDSAFGMNGIAVFPNESSIDDGQKIVVEPNGKILVAGVSRATQGGTGNGLIVRFAANGLFESSYYRTNNNDLYLQPDGKILTVGFNFDYLPEGFQITRLNNAGIFDKTFNGNGILQIGFTDVEITTAYGVTMQRDNKIVAVGLGESSIGGVRTGQFAVVRVMSGLAASHSAAFDFDGDGKSDVSVFRPTTNVWYEVQSSNTQVGIQNFGSAGDLVASADYDGDGKTDLGVFRPSSGDWWFRSSLSGGVQNVHWGAAGDFPRPSDFDGDGKADFVVYRPSTGVWYRLGSTGVTAINAFGTAEDKPLTGDFDGDGKSDVSVFRPSTGEWWRQSSVNNSAQVTKWGISTDTPVAADFDGDGKTDFAVYRGGTWYILNSGSGQPAIVNFGVSDDKPVAADYDGDGRADIAVFRPSNGVWYLLRSTAGFAAIQFGVSTDIAVPNAFVP
ncbi:MAG TPA: FG-GAP-like repeat-containing protein [Pyrinomonadaceae bacterium]|nr:FG-GAP-like repeat-containing protein [Pyrinomonadaceae bacterium]